jgi:hypothetical protein
MESDGIHDTEIADPSMRNFKALSAQVRRRQAVSTDRGTPFAVWAAAIPEGDARADHQIRDR